MSDYYDIEPWEIAPSLHLHGVTLCDTEDCLETEA